jgi:ATP-binding cassette subfamily B protein
MNNTLQMQAKAWRERLAALKNIPPVLRLIWDSSPSLTAAGMACRVLTALVPAAALYVGKLIIDTVVGTLKNGGPFPQQIWWLLAAEFLLTGAANVLNRAADYCNARMADQFSREVSLRIMRHAASLDLASFEDPVFYDKLERARVQATDRVILLSALGQLMQQCVTLISLAAGVIWFSPIVFFVLVLCVIPAFLGESHFAFLGYSLAYSLTPLRRELDYLRVLGTSKETAKELKVFGLGKYLHNRFDGIQCEVIHRNRKLMRKRLWVGALLALVSSIGYYGAYAYLVFRTLSGRQTVGDLTFLAGALMGCSSQLQQIFSTFTGIADQALFLTDLLQFFAVQPRIRSKTDAIPAPRPIRDGFEFRRVCFKYPGTDRLVLNNLDFRLHAGERIALVGANGQGKTTFVKLISRLYEPTAGHIFLDGIDLREYSIDDLQREIGVIFQDFMRYDLTARENIGVGRIDQVQNDALLHEAARKSRAIDLIERFPDGLEQILGRRFEGGVDLSGGEWQKFALARAYIRDAQLLILDEPTAALDAMAEYEVFSRFAELTRGKMAVLISHRFSTVRMTDRIVVLENGSIREQGTHQQLVQRGGRYAEMFELQAANYR